jgi:hypothetical protein
VALANAKLDATDYSPQQHVRRRAMARTYKSEQRYDPEPARMDIMLRLWIRKLTYATARTAPPVMLALMLGSNVQAAPADLATYRAFTLGTSPAEVLALTSSTPGTIKTLSERPAVLEELAWRLPYKNSEDLDPVSTITFSFIDQQLFRMVVGYDTERTRGLTRQDMIALLVDVYGPRSTTAGPAAAAPAYDSLDTVTPIANWRQGETLLVLGHSAYRDGFSLVITSTGLDALARKAQAASVTLDAREAPAREAARVKAEAEAKRAAEEKIRTTNKAGFKP